MAIAFIKTDYMMVALDDDQKWKCAIPSAQEYLNKTFAVGNFIHSSGQFDAVKSAVLAANQTLGGEIIWENENADALAE